ncbi:phosphatidylglycerophosphatase [Roseibium aggregatum]|uniref:Phosphatidylglycerophosphatase n=1 Tax=Roseibium aggregatum TaxID=187304 RepID=A0A939EAR0_9HYPH|nr:phosphatidylglycerophosphatase [Roseibium aggregatum]MBN9669752.1 phosphatidylglycerophosphatase [Roseibium aggregatum]
MMTLSGTWIDLFGLSGLLNPFALIIGAYLGWRADQPQKLWIAGFAAAALSLILETAVGLVHLPQPISQDAGALAMFPFRFAGGFVAASLALWLNTRRKQN